MASVHTNTYGGRTITLEVYEESWSIDTNKSVVRWTLKSGTSSTYHNVYEITAWVNGTDDAHKVYGPKTADWSSRAFPCKDGSVTGTVEIQHNNDGSASPVTFRLRGSVYNNNPQNYDGSIDLTNIPRYATCNQSLSDNTETSLTVNWSSDSTIDYVWYSINNGSSWTAVGSVNTTQSSYTIPNLTANTTYNIKTRVRRKDSQLTTDSAVAGWSTLAYPYISGLGSTALTIGNSQTLYLYNPKGRSITVYMKKDNTSGSQIYSSTTSNNSNTPFTFTPTASTMYNLIPNAKSGNCVYYVVYSGNTSATKSGTFVVNESSNKPTVTSSSAYDNNNTTYGLTNNRNKIVLNASNMALTINANAKNNATFNNNGYIKVNGTALTLTISGSNASGVYNLNKPSSSSYTVELKDSRGIITTTTLNLSSYVSYFTPSITGTAVRNQPTDNKVNLNGSGSRFNGSFGSQSNTLSVTYSIKEKSTSTVLETGSISTTSSGNSYTLTQKQVSNANYTKEYVATLTITDKLNSVSTNINIPKGTPVFWWNGDGVYVNGSLKKNNSEVALVSQIPTNYLVKNDLLNFIYPVGSIYMSVNNTSPQSFLGGTWVRLQDRFLIGAGNSYSVNGTGGNSTINTYHNHTTGSHTLTTDEIPSHMHNFKGNANLRVSSGTAGYAVQWVENASNDQYIHNTGGGGAHSHGDTGYAGNSSQSIIPPYLAVYMWKRTA